MHIYPTVAFTRNRTSDIVANSQSAVPLALAFAKRGEGIDGFTTLTDCKDEGVLVHRHIAISKFAGELDLCRQMRQTLDEAFTNLCGVERGAARRKNDSIDFPEFPRRHIQTPKFRRRFFNRESP